MWRNSACNAKESRRVELCQQLSHHWSVWFLGPQLFLYYPLSIIRTVHSTTSEDRHTAELSRVEQHKTLTIPINTFIAVIGKSHIFLFVYTRDQTKSWLLGHWQFTKNCRNLMKIHTTVQQEGSLKSLPASFDFQKEISGGFARPFITIHPRLREISLAGWL